MLRQLYGLLMGIAVLCLASVVMNRTITAEPLIPAGDKDRAPIRMGLLDMAKAFKSCDSFVREREQLKSKIDDFDTEAKAKAAEIQRLSGRLAGLAPDTNEYADAEAEIKRLKDDFEQFRKVAQLKMLKLETTIYHQTYQRVEAVVREYAEEYELDLVLRFDSEQISEEDPQKMLQGMARQVIYQRGLDITDDVLTILNRQ